MPNFKEIVTKAVIGKGKKFYRNTYTINTDYKVNTVLGCWVINHKLNGHDIGYFDINFSYDNDTKTSVITKNISYKEIVSVKVKGAIRENRTIAI